jgi:hypothetical protein
MRRRFGRGRNRRPSSGGRAPIDAAQWLEKIAAEGLAGATSLEPVDVPDIPQTLAVLGSGETEEGRKVLVGFSPDHGGDAALAVLAHARRLHADEGFEGEAVAIAPQWSIAARRRLPLLGETPFPFRAVAASSLDDGGTVSVEPGEALVALPAHRLANRLVRPSDRELFLRALSAFEGLAAKHGGAVRGAGQCAELVLLAQRVAQLRAGDGGVVLETLQPERSTVNLDVAGLAAAMDRLEGQLRKRLNDRKITAGDEGHRTSSLSGLIETVGLRAVVTWPLGGSDTEVIDMVGIDAEGRPVIVAVRSKLDLIALGEILDAVLKLRPSLSLLFTDTPAPVRLDAPRLLLAAGEVEDAVLRVLGALVFDHSVYDLPAQRGDASLRQEGEGARPSRSGEGRGRGRRRRRRPRGNGGDEEAASGSERETAEGGREASEESQFEEMSLFDLDDDARPEGDDSEEGGGRSRRRRGRGRRRGRRGNGSGSSSGATEAAADEGDAPGGAGGEADDDDEVDELLSGQVLDPAATLDPLGDDVPTEGDESPDYDDEEEDDLEGDEDDWLAEREARKQARLAKSEPEPEPESDEPSKAPRRRAAIVAHADRDSVAAAVLLARDIRQVEGFWVYPQEDLMTFFRSVATDLRQETPIYVVGFTGRPAIDTLQAASLYAGRLGWFDHHEWPPEDLEAMRSTIGAENVAVEVGSGSSVPAVLADRARRSRFSDKLVELVTGRFTQHDYERWGRVWWERLGRIARNPGDRRADVAPLLTGRPSDLAKEAAKVEPPEPPEEVGFVAGRDFRVVHFGGYSLVVVPVPDHLDLHLASRIARERFGTRVSLAYHEGEELVVLGGDESRGKRVLDLSSMVGYLAAKHEWIDGLRDEDHVARFRVHGLPARPERLEEVLADIAMGRSILEG